MYYSPVVQRAEDGIMSQIALIMDKLSFSRRPELFVVTFATDDSLLALIGTTDNNCLSTQVELFYDNILYAGAVAASCYAASMGCARRHTQRQVNS